LLISLSFLPNSLHLRCNRHLTIDQANWCSVAGQRATTALASLRSHAWAQMRSPLRQRRRHNRSGTKVNDIPNGVRQQADCHQSAAELGAGSDGNESDILLAMLPDAPAECALTSHSVAVRWAVSAR
jgi:hypothetical protein